MIAPKHVFISYARSDGHAVAQKLNQLLWANSIPTWQDVRNIDPHQDFSAEIEMAIEAAMHVVVCLTPSIMERKDSFVRREIIYAQGVGVPITPLLFPGFSVDRIPVLINHYTWISFLDRSCPTSRNFGQLLRRLRSSSITCRSFSAEADPFREYLHELYKNIVSYLDHTVFQLVHLHGESVADATQTQPQFRKHLTLGIFQTALPVRPSSEPEVGSLVTYRNIPEAFHAAQNQLLVLGEPGAGKTTSLMAFARDAIAARLEDPTQPLPLLGRLADWVRAGSPSIPTWLSSSLGLQENVVQQVLSQDSALLLFDGLDEIISIDEERPLTADERRNAVERRDYRKDFMREFEKCVNGNQAIVTCRAADYLAFGSKIALRGAARIRRLDDEQIMEYLSLDASLMAAIQSDSELREVIRNPLLLSFFAFAYQGQKEHADKLSNLRSAPGELLEHIFRNYVERRFEHEALRANCRPMISISDTYAILGRAAVENQDFEVTSRETTVYQGSPLKECIEQQIGDASSDFIEQALRLHLLVQYEQQTLRFVHPLVSDHFALTFALGEYLKDTTKFSYQILLQVGALLVRIGDDRAITPLLEIGTIDGRIKGQFHFYLHGVKLPKERFVLRPLVNPCYMRLTEEISILKTSVKFLITS
jgi:hypothetical protein